MIEPLDQIMYISQVVQALNYTALHLSGMALVACSLPGEQLNDIMFRSNQTNQLHAA